MWSTFSKLAWILLIRKFSRRKVQGEWKSEKSGHLVGGYWGCNGTCWLSLVTGGKTGARPLPAAAAMATLPPAATARGRLMTLRTAGFCWLATARCSASLNHGDGGRQPSVSVIVPVRNVFGNCLATHWIWFRLQYLSGVNHHCTRLFFKNFQM